MQSAFGVEHGEISKAKLPRSKWAHKAGQAFSVGRGKAKATGEKLGAARVSINDLGRATGRGAQHAGRGLYNVGAAMERNPGRTASGVIGAGVGAGAYGGKKLADREPKKSRNVPKGM